MSRKSRLITFAEQVGFDTESESGLVRAVRVPCLLEGGVPGTCTIETSCDPATGKPDGRIGRAAHAVKITLDGEYDGQVYNADGIPIGNYLGGDGKTWSEISIRKGASDSPEVDESGDDLIHRYAKQIIGAASANGYDSLTSRETTWPFKIPNTFEDRAGIKPVQNRIRCQRVAIIGLGGTGAYLLDLLVKAPVEIHLLDSDCVEWHNLMRAPGAPTAEEIEQVRAGALRKVDYYRAKYEAFREAIHAHPIRVESPSMFAEFLSEYPIDYAFVCIDQLTDSDTPRQDDVYRALSEAGIPFIDSGVSIMLEGSAVTGAVTTSAYESGSDLWDAIPNARVVGGVPGYRNVQLPEVNAAAAAFAVMEWRRRTGQYVSKSSSFITSFVSKRLTSSMLNESQDLPQVKLRPIFVEVLPPFNSIKDGELWISHKHQTINLRCPCGCGELTVLSLHPSRWHVYFDGKSISLKGPTGGSVWASSSCSSHYFIRNNAVVWSHWIDPHLRKMYEDTELSRMISPVAPRQTLGSLLRRVWRTVSIRRLRK